MQLPDLDHLDIDKLSIEEINNLLPQLDEALEELNKRKPIHEVVSDKFSECWQSIEDEITGEFYESLEEERERFIFNNGFRMVLERSMGEEYTQEFFKVLKVCMKKKSFRPNVRFYRTTKNPQVNRVAEVGFTVYRLYQSKKRSDDFIGGKWIKGKISELKRDDNPEVQAIVKDFTEIGLIPS